MFQTIRIMPMMAAMLVALPCSAFEEPRSGLEPGASRAPFNVLDVTGPHAGTTVCYACDYGRLPTICIFARSVTPSLADLIERLDAKLFTNAQLRCFVVILTDKPDAATGGLSELARSRDLRNIPLTVFAEPEGLDKYQLDPEAAITVLMWSDMRLKVNRGFDSADLSADQIDSILAAIPDLIED